MGKMRYVIVCLCVLMGSVVYAQNLVPNPSFEIGEPKCTLIRPADADEFNESIDYWYRPTLGSSDIYNTFSSVKCRLSVYFDYLFAFGNYGNQVPRTGNYHAALISLAHNIYVPKDSSKQREYLQTPLIAPLEIGEIYCGEMYVSFANMRRASNNMSMLFSTDSIYVDNKEGLLRKAQVVEKQVILDTANWVRVAGAFLADSSYEYLALGNFDTNEETEFIMSGFGESGYNTHIAYYFIDDVAVYKLDNKDEV